MQAKFKEIYERIEQDIRQGKYDQTRQLKTEDEYVTLYDVSRVTVRHAIDQLIRRGYCYPVQGKGVFLRRHKIAGATNLENIRGLTHDLSPQVVTSKIISFQNIPADAFLADKLDCAVDTPVTFIERQRFADGQAISLERLYYNSEKVPLTPDACLGSIYEYVQSKLGIKLCFIDYVIGAVKLTRQEADLLCLDEGDPGFVFENLGMDRRGKVVHYGRTVYHYQKIRSLKMASYL
jgi:GntR family transcriptional regulator of bglA